MENVRQIAREQYKLINSFPKDGMSWHIWKFAFDRASYSLKIEAIKQLDKANKRIEELEKELNEVVERLSRSQNARILHEDDENGNEAAITYIRVSDLEKELSIKNKQK